MSGGAETTRMTGTPEFRGLDDVETVGVVGAGTMGNGIAQVSATAGYDVVMRDVEEAFVDSGLDAIDDSLSRLVRKEVLTDDEADAARDRVTGTTDLGDLGDADLVVEAAPEEMDLKRDVFADLDEATAGDVVLATNTSTLSVTTIAAATDRAPLVLGLHFVNRLGVEPRGLSVDSRSTRVTRKACNRHSRSASLT